MDGHLIAIYGLTAVNIDPCQLPDFEGALPDLTNEVLRYGCIFAQDYGDDSVGYFCDSFHHYFPPV